MTTKSHAKNQLIWTKNGREMAVLSFPAFFGVGGPFLDIFGILGPKMGSKVPYLISGIARNGNYYLPCDFEPDWCRVKFRENFQGVYPLFNLEFPEVYSMNIY